MLKHLSTIWEYRDFLSSHINDFDDVQLRRLESLPFKRAVHKLKKLDIELAADVILKHRFQMVVFQFLSNSLYIFCIKFF
ncbi:MAG: hypothetical protein IJI66_16580 [Erysipelotrichaceae bacterium]|nr:hypothetical protein [Erysipelotrichaceae bacterium]